MIKAILPIILVGAAVLLFFTFIDPTYKKVQAVQAEVLRYDDALNKSKELQSIRDQLLAKYNTFSTDDLKRLELLLPDNVDNIRLVLDVDTVASKYGMVIKNLQFSSAPTGDGSFSPDQNEIKSVDLSFSVSAEYEEFLSFIKDLQDSLRIIDIVEIDFSVVGSVFNEYKVIIRTYWLP